MVGLITDIQRHIADFERFISQQLLRLDSPALINVLRQVNTLLLFEEAGQVRRIEIMQLGQPHQRQVFAQMAVDIVTDPFNNLRGAFFLGCASLLEEIGGQPLQIIDALPREECSSSRISLPYSLTRP